MVSIDLISESVLGGCCLPLVSPSEFADLQGNIYNWKISLPPVSGGEVPTAGYRGDGERKKNGAYLNSVKQEYEHAGA
ncbi:hypothetical protein V6N12_050021 [Hibiscus sabdariffa]|uniref:Uncharacterized protein n=1 Tax=Hibiscus sabdariffa TaxID=183260 RepID=A0ABR2GB79_9ROSI